MNENRVFASNKNWIESSAIDQLKRSGALPGMLAAIGMPDLHPGKGSPIGAVFLTEKIAYPYLIGGDIGCGMTFVKTDLSRKKINLDKWVRKLERMSPPAEETIRNTLESFDVRPTDFDGSLGTIGRGNHFAELQVIENIVDNERAQANEIEEGAVYLLVHSGSRGYGNAVLQQHIEQFRDEGLATEDPAFPDYLTQHENALRWARANRALIAETFCHALNTSSRTILDIFHNYLERNERDGRELWIHRKGAAPANRGPVVIPGSRGSFSYLVEPGPAISWASGFSLAHGAGRKWDRASALHRVKAKYKKTELQRTKLGSRVICSDKTLLYEEAPEAYKNIDVVVQDLVDFGLARVVAVLRPIISYKVFEENVH